MPEGSSTPWSYVLIRLLFQFVLKIFYGTIVVENTHFIPPRGEPCIVSANHSNSLTDALLLVTAIPFKRRNLLRLTAKSTQFNKRTFTSWLIESAGTVPIKRPKDFPDVPVDNAQVMLHLMEALEQGDAVCLFPEGMSRYHPTIAPLKTGVARLVSDVLTRQRDDPDFEVSVLTCSITYMHRQHWRSDVLVTFHPPIKFRPKDNPELLAPIDYNDIRALTARMHQQISSGTLDAPNWRLLRNAKLAARMYAPLGTSMSLGDYVRVVRIFLEAFKLAEVPPTASSSDGASTASDGEVVAAERAMEEKKLIELGNDLKGYQDQLVRWGIKDDRVRRPLPRHTILTRLPLRLWWALFLFMLSIPGLLLWLPVLITTFIGISEFKRTGPVWDTWDEIAQYKLMLPIAPFTAVFVPACMWMALRWMEDAISAFRAFVTLVRLLRVGQGRLAQAREQRERLYARVMHLAVYTLGLPPDPETYFAESGGSEKGRVRGRWASKAKYFSLRRRRKQDWNEILRLYDEVDYPEADY